MRTEVLYRDGREVFHADTCVPLSAAAERGEVRLSAVARGGYPGNPLRRDQVPEVATVGYWDAGVNQHWGLAPHRNEGVELTCLARGSLHFRVDGRRYLLRRGQVTITRPWQLHQVGDPHVSASRLHWLILDVGVRRPNQTWRWPDWLVCSPADLRRLTTLLSHNEQPVWDGGRDIVGCFERVAQLIDAGRLVGPSLARLKLYINELLVVLLELLDRQRIPLDDSLSTTQRAVEIFLLRELPRRVSEPWTLDTMAAACGLARTRFSDYCRRVTNLSPLRYLAQCRVAAAQQMLRDDPRRPVTDVALDCGFSSSQYFATVFKRLSGSAPGRWQKVAP